MHFKITQKLSTSLKLGVGMSTLLAMSSTAFAQEPVTEDATVRLDTVTVTAAKREQTLQEIPIAVSVVSDVEIERAEIQDIFDLQSVVPSLTVSQSTTSANSGFAIRGFGGIVSNAGIEPSVGVFVDGVYRSRASAQISDLVGIERVEVLRGPRRLVRSLF